MHMVYNRRVSSVVVTAVAMLALGSKIPAAPEYLSPVGLVASKDGKTLFVIEATANQVAAFDVASGKVVKTFPVPNPPTGAALSPDGKQLYITCEHPNGKVHVVDTASGKVGKKIHVHHTPMAPVITPDGKTLCVCNRFSGTLSIIDLAAGKETAKVRLVREPIAAAVTADGKFLYVANHLPSGSADGAYLAAVVSVIDIAKAAVVAEIKLPNGSTGLRGLCISPDGKHVYVTHILARYQVPTTQLERGWMNTNALTIIDANGKKHINTVLLDNVDLGAANPWGVVCTPDGKFICVTHAGTHEISVIDREKLHARLDDVAAGKRVTPVSSKPDNVPNDLSFLVDVRRRHRLSGNGPRGIAAIGSKVYAAQYFSDDLAVVDTTPGVHYSPKAIPLGPKPKMSKKRRGEAFFSDASLCFQHWQSCSSCHPDGRADALNWDLLNDGIGNPKQTKNMLLTHKTPPSMVSGIRDKAETAVRAGIRYIQFAVRPDEDAQAIDEYLKSMEPVQSPYLVYGDLSKAAQRGKKIFAQAGCAGCHPAPLHTDLKIYDMGMGKYLDKDRPFDTPTLIEAWRTAPYLYDGRSATLKEVLKRDNPNDRHGTTSKLSEAQLADLMEYVLSL